MSDKITFQSTGVLTVGADEPALQVGETLSTVESDIASGGYSNVIVGPLVVARGLAIQGGSAALRTNWPLEELDVQVVVEPVGYESPFDTLEELRHPEVQVQNIVAYLRQSPIAIPCADRLAERLEFLISEAAREAADGHATVEPDSVRALIGFLAWNENLEFPDVMLTPSGHVLAEWHVSTGQHLGIEFLGDGVTARYVVFAPASPHFSRREGKCGYLCDISCLVPTTYKHMRAPTHENRV